MPSPGETAKPKESLMPKEALSCCSRNLSPNFLHPASAGHGTRVSARLEQVVVEGRIGPSPREGFLRDNRFLSIRMIFRLPQPRERGLLFAGTRWKFVRGVVRARRPAPPASSFQSHGGKMVCGSAQ